MKRLALLVVRRSRSRCRRSRSRRPETEEDKGDSSPRSGSCTTWIPIHHRPDRHVDQQGGRVPAARRALSRCLIGIVFMRVKVGTRPEPPPGARRDDLRGRAGAGRRAGAADEGDRALVPVRRVADDLHLGRQHARLHPAAALGRDGDDRRRRAADARDLRRDVDALRHARARADDVRRSRTSRGSARTARWNYFKSWIPDVPEGDAAADHPARDPRPVHAADQPVGPSLREHARRPHADPHVHRAHLRARERVSRRSSPFRPRRVFYLFEVVIVVSIQAYIFAALSAIYIGSAIEPEH